MVRDTKRFLDYLARCDQAFRPFTPVNLPDFFKGRQDEIRRVMSELRSPGRQVAIFGERGVGKTSLALLIRHMAAQQGHRSFIVRCEAHHRFDDIFGQILGDAGHAYVPNGIETESSRSAGLGVHGVHATSARATRARYQAIGSSRSISSALLLSVFRNDSGLLILDEFDRVSDQDTRTRLAETLKHFSDADCRTKILVVGVAETLTALIGEHQSLTRCLAQIHLGRMSREELVLIIKTGEERTGAIFRESVRRKIIAQSDGFPFYTHLLSKYAAEEAGKPLADDPDIGVTVDDVNYRHAVRQAIQNAEADVREEYHAAVITTKRKTEMYRLLLWAVAFDDSIEVQVNSIAQNLARITRSLQEIRPQAFANHLGALISEEKRRILTRVRAGYYKFTNPLMRAYIRLLLEEENYLSGVQLEFPWMHERPHDVDR